MESPLATSGPVLFLPLPDNSTDIGHQLDPFHKLTGWIAYSLIEPMERILNWKFEDMVGLPEYRNGLFSFPLVSTIGTHIFSTRIQAVYLSISVSSR
jgi:hypothetical protein